MNTLCDIKGDEVLLATTKTTTAATTTTVAASTITSIVPNKRYRPLLYRRNFHKQISQSPESMMSEGKERSGEKNIQSKLHGCNQQDY